MSLHPEQILRSNPHTKIIPQPSTPRVVSASAGGGLRKTLGRDVDRLSKWPLRRSRTWKLPKLDGSLFRGPEGWECSCIETCVGVASDDVFRHQDFHTHKDKHGALPPRQIKLQNIAYLWLERILIVVPT